MEGNRESRTVVSGMTYEQVKDFVKRGFEPSLDIFLEGNVVDERVTLVVRPDARWEPERMGAN